MRQKLIAIAYFAKEDLSHALSIKERRKGRFMSELVDQMTLAELLEHEDELIRFQALILKKCIEDWLNRERTLFEKIELELA